KPGWPPGFSPPYEGAAGGVLPEPGGALGHAEKTPLSGAKGVARDMACLHHEARPSTNPIPSVSRGATLIGDINGQVEPGPRTLRRVLEVVDAPLPPHRLGLMTGGRVVITEDGRGVAEIVAGRLEAAGVPAERIGDSERPVDWTSPSSMDSLVVGL